MISNKLQMLLKAIIVSACLASTAAQPLHLPAESFKCGSSVCERWGYDTCVSPDGESYCLPCSHEYLQTLCGTKDEIGGCNLFCTKLALDKETRKVQSEFSDKMNKFETNCSNNFKLQQENFTETLKDVKKTFFMEKKTLQENAVKNFAKFQKELQEKENICTSLEIEINHLKKKIKVYHNHSIVLYILLAFSVSVNLFLLVFAIEWFRKCRKQRRTSTGKEFLNGSKAMDETKRLVLEDPEKLQPPQRMDKINCLEKAVQTEKDNEIKTDTRAEKKTSNLRIGHDDKVLGDECPGYAKLQNINPTEKDHHESPKLAIGGQLHDCPK